MDSVQSCLWVIALILKQALALETMDLMREAGYTGVYPGWQVIHYLPLNPQLPKEMGLMTGPFWEWGNWEWLSDERVRLQTQACTAHAVSQARPLWADTSQARCPASPGARETRLSEPTVCEPRRRAAGGWLLGCSTGRGSRLCAGRGRERRAH